LLLVEELDEDDENGGITLDEGITAFPGVLEQRLNRRLDGPGYSGSSIAYHVMIMEEGGLIAKNNQEIDGKWSPYIAEYRLTWKGHEFLETVRNNSIWDKAKQLVFEKSGGAAIDLLFEAAKKIILTFLGA
jgi:repressor of nif and glnA expression